MSALILQKLQAAAAVLSSEKGDPAAQVQPDVSATGEAVDAQLPEEDAAKTILASLQADLADRNEVSARRRYMAGLLGAVLASIALLFAGYFLFTWVVTSVAHRQLNDAEAFALRDLLTCIAGGALGALLSVLLRIANRRHVNYEAVLQGAARWRILLGWLFAIAVVALIKGSVIDIFVDPTTTMLAEPKNITDSEKVVSWFFWVALGLLAGFNERWATQLLSRDQNGTGEPPSQSPNSKIQSEETRPATRRNGSPP